LGWSEEDDKLPTASLSQAHANLSKTKKSSHLLHIYVVQSNSDWCPSPCQGPTWELAAPKATEGSGYHLVEAAIWRQERRVAFYHFDQEWYETARRSNSKLCDGGGWACEAYQKWREDRRLAEFGPWSDEVDGSPEKLSTFLREAFQEILHLANQRAPDAKYVTLTYSGHGARADGALFQGAVSVSDTSTLLQNFTQVLSTKTSAESPRISLLNFGGNCAEARWNMLHELHAFADWIVASDLDVGGFQMTPEESKTADMSLIKKLGDLKTIKNGAEAGESINQIAASIVRAKGELWEKVYQPTISRQKLPQSISAFKSFESFPPLEAALRTSYSQTASADAFDKGASDAMCDVFSFLSMAEIHGAERSVELVNLFKALRPEYSSTQSMVSEWPSKSNGLGFNWRGWKEPPCDLQPITN